jgi:enamine deaminase RidA (YjgF/YER057c/UK114 family)
MKLELGDPELYLAQKNIILPSVIPPVGSYTRARSVNNVLYLSGHLPDSAGEAKYMGKLGGEVSVEDGYAAARLAMINSLGSAKQFLGDLRRVKRFVKLIGFVNCTADFIRQPEVVNGASDLIAEVFGPDIGTHARSAVGMFSLPRGNCVEIETILEFS